MYQYRVTVNGTQGNIVDTLPDKQWTRIANVLESRGGIAVLDRRIVSDYSILPLLVNTAGYIVLPDNVVVGPWCELAKLDL